MTDTPAPAAQPEPARGDAPDRTLDLLLVGCIGVGKTSLVKRYTDDRFSKTSYAITMVEKSVRTIDAGGERVRLVICDVGGQTRFAPLRRQLYERADGVIYVYDVTNAQSLHGAQRLALELRALDKKRESARACVLVGTHTDVGTASDTGADRRGAHPINAAAVPWREVAASAGAAAATLLGMRHAEASALSGAGVAAVFEDLARAIVAQRRDAENEAADVDEARESGATLLRRGADADADAGADDAPRRGRWWRCCC